MQHPITMKYMSFIKIPKNLRSSSDELFVSATPPRIELAQVSAPAQATNDLARTEARLRALGYVDGE